MYFIKEKIQFTKLLAEHQWRAAVDERQPHDTTAPQSSQEVVIYRKMICDETLRKAILLCSLMTMSLTTLRRARLLSPRAFHTKTLFVFIGTLLRR